jgi:hypothetical protein
MIMNPWLEILFSGLIATLLMILYNILHNFWNKEKQRKREMQQHKLEILRTLIGHRGQLTSGGGYGKEFEVAINQVYIVFRDNSKVLESFESFRMAVNAVADGDSAQEQRNTNAINALVSLLKQMCNDLEIDYSFANDDLFTRPITIGVVPQINVVNNINFPLELSNLKQPSKTE